jgi:2-(1,2-epoxy-1,2-dihydrophenyl)acetyl-CoA isomerase
MSGEELVRVQRQGAVMILILDRPKVNALTEAMAVELVAALEEAGRDREIRALILTGAGWVFSAGQDLSDLLDVPPDFTLREHLERSYNRLVLALRGLQKPVLAAINGPVAGAALGVALATDIRLAAESARFLFGFSGIALAADSGTSLLLPLLVGLGRASEMAFLNQPLSAQQALEVGLVNRVVPDETLQEEALRWAQRLAAMPTAAIGLTKAAFNRALMPHLAQVLEYEALLQELAFRGEDHREGVRAFLEKREPQFRGR